MPAGERRDEVSRGERDVVSTSQVDRPVEKNVSVVVRLEDIGEEVLIGGVVVVVEVEVQMVTTVMDLVL